MASATLIRISAIFFVCFFFGAHKTTTRADSNVDSHGNTKHVPKLLKELFFNPTAKNQFSSSLHQLAGLFSRMPQLTNAFQSFAQSDQGQQMYGLMQRAVVGAAQNAQGNVVGVGGSGAAGSGASAISGLHELLGNSTQGLIALWRQQQQRARNGAHAAKKNHTTTTIAIESGPKPVEIASPLLEASANSNVEREARSGYGGGHGMGGYGGYGGHEEAKLPYRPTSALSQADDALTTIGLTFRNVLKTQKPRDPLKDLLPLLFALGAMIIARLPTPG